jgi:hypothetical protein
MDQALTPMQDTEDETFDYMTKTDGAKAAIDHFKKVAELTHKNAPRGGQHQATGLNSVVS